MEGGASEVASTASCSLDASFTFDGHGYIPVESLPDLAGGKVRIGERLSPLRFQLLGRAEQLN